MAYWLAKMGDAQQHASLKRFDPRYWTVNFPRPMMAGVTTTGPHSLRVDAVFYKENDLAGLIWEAEDKVDHPLLAYETSRDFRGCTLSFGWQSSGIKALDAINGPTLTIEGRDAAGVPKSWFVRLWNYALGTPTNAAITIDFDALAGGFALPGDAQPVFAGDIDRMFVSLVPPGYSGNDVPLSAAVEAWLTLTDIKCDGAGSVLRIGDVLVPPHGLAIATGYDDSYNLTPERVLRNIFMLGYRGSLNHYVGMSHHFRLERLGSDFYVSSAGGALNAACTAWHVDFATRAKDYGYSLIVSLSYELFDAHCWNDWKQRASNGDPALTGYTPPSVLLSPSHTGAKNYLRGVARAFVQIAVTAGHAPRFQIGEPWWWVLPDGRICLYDNAAKVDFGGNPVQIANVRSTSLNAAQKSLLDAAGGILALSTQELVDAVRFDHPTCQALLLVFLPTVLDEAAPDLKRANVPVGWASPAFNVLQLEDYDWVTTANVGASALGAAVMTTRLNYPVAAQHYLAGFVLSPGDKAQWRLIDDAAQVGKGRGVAETIIWASPQVMRDGFTHFNEGEAAVQAFDDVSFPLVLGAQARVSPTFSTAIVTTASGREQRSAAWASGRLRYDVGTGVRSEADVQSLIAFFRARRGAARGFRFRDPLDHSSNGMTGVTTANDQRLGSGDGVRTSFALLKSYGSGAEAEQRRITRPEAASVKVALAGVVQASGWTLGANGTINFAVAPPTGAAVSAGFRFDVPVRFAEDGLDIDMSHFSAGDAPNIPLIEVREG
jgi:uncharacterized protein (TIGR02217 family)